MDIKPGDVINYYEGCDATVTAVHEHWYGRVVDLVLDNGVVVTGFGF